MRRGSDSREPVALQGLYSSLRSQQKELFQQTEAPSSVPSQIHQSKLSPRIFIMLLISNLALGSLTIHLVLSYIDVLSSELYSSDELVWPILFCPLCFVVATGLICFCLFQIRHHFFVFFISTLLFLFMTVSLLAARDDSSLVQSLEFWLVQLILLSILASGTLTSGWELFWRTGDIKNNKLVSLFAASRSLPSLRIIALLWEASLFLVPSLVLIGSVIALVIAVVLCISAWRSRTQSSIFLESEEERQQRIHSQMQQQSLLNHSTAPSSNQFDILPFLEQQHGVRQISQLTAQTPIHSPGTESQGSQGEQSYPSSLQEDIKLTAERKRQYFKCDIALNIVVCGLLGLTLCQSPSHFWKQFSILHIWIVILIFAGVSLFCYKAFVSRFWLESAFILSMSVLFLWKALGGEQLKPASLALAILPLLIFYLPLYGGAQRPLKKYFVLVSWTLLPVVCCFFSMPLPYKNWVSSGSSLAASLLLLCLRRLLPE